MFVIIFVVGWLIWFLLIVFIIGLVLVIERLVYLCCVCILLLDLLGEVVWVY